MILNTGSRTDIPAYFSRWFFNRVADGSVLVRNPYNPHRVTSYQIDPAVVDLITFCTKKPAPMLDRLDELSAFDTFWHVTITPYGKDIEPFVPPVSETLDSFRKLSAVIGKNRVVWRYDPVVLTERYDVRCHIRAFESMSAALEGWTDQCVVSFLDLYEKTKRNFPEAASVGMDDQERLIDAFTESAERHGLQIHLCCENSALVRKRVDADGCFSQKIIEDALGSRLIVPKHKEARPICRCLLGSDIGAYNTCGHGCRYCYANYDRKTVKRNLSLHNPDSALLIGHLKPDDIVTQADQKSWKDRRIRMEDLL